MQRSVLLVIVVVITLVVAGFLCFTQFAMVQLGSSPGNSAQITPSATDPETGGAAAEDLATEAVRRSLVAEVPPGGVSTVAGTNVLRVVIEGITEERAGMVKVTVAGFDSTNHRTSKVRDSWPCQGLTSEFDLDPFFAALAERSEDLRVDELKIGVKHPLHFRETIHVPLSRGVELTTGQIVYEARVRLDEAVFWPEFTLAVRDKRTRAHLEDVELRFVNTSYMGMWQQPGSSSPFFLLGSGLSSPIALRGGHKSGQQDSHAAGIALRPAVGEALRPVELDHPAENARGIMMYARAPGYAWGRIVLDVSKDATRELLLGPATGLSVRFANVQLERYTVLEKPATLCVTRIGPDGGVSGVFYHRLDETLATGLRIEGLEPGEHAVSVELGGAFSWRKRHVLARETLALAAGKTHELVLVLADSLTPELATLGGVLSFPAFGGENKVRLWLYHADYKYGDPDFELSLADMAPVASALPTWSFRLADLPVGRYQVRLMPFEKNWMIELPAGGRDDMEFVVPELAEVLVETVDAQTGERIPLKVIRYGTREDLPGQIHHDHSSQRNTASFEGKPGRFRFWTPPGAAYVSTFALPSELNLGIRRLDLELVPGLQSVRFELAPACSLLFEFRVDGAALPREDGIFWGLSRRIRAIGHEGRVGAVTYSLLQASAPGLYEISFEGIGKDRFHPIPPRQVNVREGETTEVIVELQRK